MLVETVTIAVEGSFTEEFVKVVMEYREQTVVSLKTNDIEALMAAVLLALGYSSVQFDKYFRVRPAIGSEQGIIRQLVDAQPGAVFVCGPATKGHVVLESRYSDEFCEFRLDVLVDGNRMGSSIDMSYGMRTFAGVLTALGYAVFEVEMTA